MITDVLYIIFCATIVACFSWFLDFCLGHPGKENITEVNTKAILFGYTFLISKCRLKMYHRLYEEIHIANFSNLNSCDPVIKVMAEKQFKIMVLQKARELFTFEHALGMCVYCTNFWLSAIFTVFLFWWPQIDFIQLPNIFLLCIPFISHFIIRKI